jgi:hypothetical protein
MSVTSPAFGGEISTHHLARELGCVRQDLAHLSVLVIAHGTALSHIADQCAAIRAQLTPDVASYRKPPRIPWRLFLTALSSALLAVGASHLLWS